MAAAVLLLENQAPAHLETIGFDVSIDNEPFSCLSLYLVSFFHNCSRSVFCLKIRETAIPRRCERLIGIGKIFSHYRAAQPRNLPLYINSRLLVPNALLFSTVRRIIAHRLAAANDS